MAQNVNVWLENWHATGQKVEVDQYEVDLRIQWTSDVGTRHEHEETVRFPNALAPMPLVWLREELEDLILRAVRKRLGVD